MRVGWREPRLSLIRSFFKKKVTSNKESEYFYKSRLDTSSTRLRENPNGAYAALGKEIVFLGAASPSWGKAQGKTMGLGWKGWVPEGCRAQDEQIHPLCARANPERKRNLILQLMGMRKSQ